MPMPSEAEIIHIYSIYIFFFFCIVSICFSLSCYEHLLFYKAHLTLQGASHLTIYQTNQCFRNVYYYYYEYFILRCFVKLQLKSGAFVSYAWLCILLVFSIIITIEPRCNETDMVHKKLC